MNLDEMQARVTQAAAFQKTLDEQGVGRPKTEATDQPMPAINDEPFIHDQVAVDVARRGELGRQRYGTKLQAFNGRRSLQDAYEELLDGACYVLQAKTEVDAVIAAWCALDADERDAVARASRELHEVLQRLVPFS